MRIEVCLSTEPLELARLVIPGCGAVARFDGLVRGEEAGRTITALHYEAYQPMAERTMQDLLRGLGERYPFELARVRHRTGWVPVGEAAILVEIHSRHRAEAFAVLAGFMDALKREVPIWKTGAR